LINRAYAFLRKHMPDAEQRIKRTIEQWNQIIRNAIIAETGLRLSVGDEQQQVPVRIQPGMPTPFADLAIQIEPELWELLFNQHLLSVTQTGLQLLLDNRATLRSYTRNGFSDKDIEHVQELLQAILAELEKRNFAAQFMAIDQDVLGAYFFHYASDSELLRVPARPGAGAQASRAHVGRTGAADLMGRLAAGRKQLL
jgi:hypothetical protein